MNYTIPLLVTIDVHVYPEVEKEFPFWIEETLKLLDDLSIKATFFSPAVVAEQFSRYVYMISKEGHEIGCHGLRHTCEEQYNSMPYNKQKDVLYEAKKRIEGVVSKEVISFRAPAFKINGDTIKALEETHFKADSSVNSQRLGIFSSDITNIGWIYSPRKPYHPDFKNPFVKGKSSLWEIPLSAFIFPFMSNLGMAFGKTFMTLFFQMLYLESNFRKNPIVYLFHPEDIYPKGERTQYKFKWSHLLPSKKMGFEIRNILYNNKNPEKISQQTITLLRMMKDIKNIKFMTAGELVNCLQNQRRIK